KDQKKEKEKNLKLLEKEENDLKEVKNPDVKFAVDTYVFIVSYESTRLCDCLFVDSNKFIKNPKIVHFTNDNKVYIYKEKLEELQKLKVCEENMAHIIPFTKVYEKV